MRETAARVLVAAVLASTASCGGEKARDQGPVFEGKPAALHAKDLQMLRDQVVQRARLAELAARPDGGSPVFVFLLQGDDARLAEQAAMALTSDAEKRAEPAPAPEDLLGALEAALHRPEAGVRAAAAPALAVLSPPARAGTARAIAGLLKDNDYRVRREALRAFRLLGAPGEGWIPEIRALLRAASSESLEAAVTLASLGDAAGETVERLAAAAADTAHPADAARAVQALGLLGPPARGAAPALGKALASRSLGRMAADYADAVGLVSGADAAATALLEKMLEDRDAENRGAAVLALARLGKNDPRLADLATSGTAATGLPSIRSAEARILLGKDEEAAFDSLLAPLDGKNADLAVAALRALGRLPAAGHPLPEKAREALKAAAAKGPLAIRRAAAKAVVASTR